MVFVMLLPAPALADPPSHAQWLPIPELSDEFNGAVLDASKWRDHNPDWPGRQPGWFAPHNVAVGSGQLLITTRAEDLPNLPAGYHTFTTAAVKSVATVKYGYFEVKVRPMRSRPSSTFFLYRDTPEEWTEIDVFEIGGGAPGHERTVYCNSHLFRNATYHGTVEKHLTIPGTYKTEKNLADDFHVYGLEWNAKEIKWYLDGAVIHRIDNQHWHQALHMNFDNEICENWFGLPEKETLPATYRIEYVRSWKLLEPSR